MTRKQLSEAIGAKLDKSSTEAEDFINAFVDVSKDTVARGKEITIRGFGSFGVKVRRAKKARNLKTGETMTVPTHKIAYFKPSKQFNALVNI